MLSEDTIQLLHPDPLKSGPRISTHKYELFRNAILKAVPNHEKGVPFKELPQKVKKLLPHGVSNSIGSIPWYTTTVKLHLEATGEIVRVTGAKPQRLRRVSK